MPGFRHVLQWLLCQTFDILSKLDLALLYFGNLAIALSLLLHQALVQSLAFLHGTHSPVMLAPSPCLKCAWLDYIFNFRHVRRTLYIDTRRLYHLCEDNEKPQNEILLTFLLRFMKLYSMHDHILAYRVKVLNNPWEKVCCMFFGSTCTKTIWASAELFRFCRAGTKCTGDASFSEVTLLLRWK